MASAKHLHDEVPVAFQHGMGTFPQAVDNILRLAVKAVCGHGMPAPEFFTLRIRPQILRSAYHNKLSGSNHCQQFVLVEGHRPPTQRRDNAAPQHPEFTDTTAAKRLSVAPAHRAVLPSRECPITVTLFISTTSEASLSMASSALLAVHDQHATAPHSSGRG